MQQQARAWLKAAEKTSHRNRTKFYRLLIFSLLAPILVTVVPAPPAMAATLAASDGYCTQTINSTSGVSVIHDGNSCVVIFSAPSNVTSSNTWTVPNLNTTYAILVVGGGGSGGVRHAAGGGAGGYIYQTGISLTSASNISISVGKGGDAVATNASNGNSGTASSFSTYSAAGGGFGGQTSAGGNGGSGGGGCCSNAAGLGNTPSTSPSQGNNGGTGTRGSNEWNWSGGGGGGSGSVGGNSTSTSSITGVGDYTTSGTVTGGAGGNGTWNSISGTAACYAAGGGGGVASTGANGGAGGRCDSTTVGGRGGKGPNGTSPNYLATQGMDGTGSGGGGGGFEAGTNSASGRGGSGIVIVRYDLPVVTLNVNGGSGFTGSTSLTVAANGTVTLPAAGSMVRSGFTFAGWNTAANGRGTNYAPSASITPTSNQTLFARWQATISYNGNSATSTRSIETTTVYAGESPTALSTGRLVQGSLITNGLRVNLDASNPASYPGTGSTWTDLSGNGNNATLMNSPAWDSTTGSFRFDGINDHATLGNFSGFNATTPYTLSITFKTYEPMKTQGLITKHNGGVAGYQIFGLSSGGYRVAREVSPWEFTTASIVDPSVITQASMTYDGTAMRVYVNGNLIQSQNSGSVGTTSAVDMLIGARLNNSNPIEFFSGLVYSIQIYNRALSATELLQNYQATDPSAVVSKTGSTLTGWSTTNDSSTPVITNASNPYNSSLPTPYYRLEAKNYNGSTWAATAGSTASLSLSYSTTRPTLNANQTGWGATGTFSTVSGAAASSVFIGLNNPTLTTYTLCALARYRSTGVNTPTVQRIFTGSSVNYLAGWFGGSTQRFYNENWKIYNTTSNDYNWHYFCDSGNSMYWDGNKLTTTTFVTNTKLPPLNIGGNYSGGEYSDFEVAEVQIYDQFLTANQIANINRYFKNTYGITNGAVDTATTTLNTPFSYAPTGSTTLNARWGATVTYDGNNQASGTPPQPSVFANGNGVLASNSGNLTQFGEVFYGWNTRADGTGIFYRPGATYTGGDIVLYAMYRIPVQIASTLTARNPINLLPYMRFEASNYDAAKKIWYDSSGNSRNTSYVRGAPTVVTTTANTNGSTRSFSTVQGTTSDGIQFKNPTMNSGNWTIFSVARYNGTQSGLARIFDGEAGNFLFGFYNSMSGVAHYNGWVASTNSFGNNWLVSTGYTDNYRAAGVLSSNSTFGRVSASANVVDTLQQMTINAGQLFATEPSNWQVAEFLIFDRQLTIAEIQQVEDYLASTYGISGSANQNSYLTGSTLSVALGTTRVSDTITAINGLNNTFSVSPVIPGISLNVSGNSASLTVAPTLALGTYFETITVTDSAGNSANLAFQINVVNPLIWSNLNPTQATVTLGKQSRIALSLSGGFGTRTATLTHSSSPAPRGVTLDTSSIASGTVQLVIDSSTAAGTYVESLTVVDGTNAVKTLILTLKVNIPPDITYTAQSDAPYPYITQNLLLNVDASNLASYSGTGSAWSDISNSRRTFNFRNDAGTALVPTLNTNFGGSLTFDGTNHALMSTSLPALDSYTVEAWFNSSQSNSADDWRAIITDIWSGSGNKINYYLGYGATAGQLCGGFFNGSAWSNFACAAISTNTWYHAVYTLTPKVSGTRTLNLYLNGILVATNTTTLDPGTSNLGNRIGRRWDAAQFFTGQISAVRVYGGAFTQSQVLINYQNSKPRFFGITQAAPTNSGRVSLSATEGKDSSFSLFTANDGTGDKVFSLSNTNSRLSLDTSTSNTAILNVSPLITATNSMTPRIYSETLTATDSQGVATAYYVSLTVNPRIIVTATTDTVTTTFGRVAYDTLTTTASTGTGNITFTRVSSSGSSAITHTSTVGSPAQAVMTIGASLPAGTYFETFTATDAVGATTVKVIQIVVNPAPTLSPENGVTAISTTYTKAAQLRLNVSGGTGTRTFNITNSGGTTPWKITLETSTSNLGYITLLVDSYTATGRSNTTVGVTDALGVFNSIALTVDVNDVPRIQNTLTPHSIVTSGLVYHLDGANKDSARSSTNWTDLAGNKTPTVFSNAPTYNSNDGEGSFSFNGSSNFITVPGITTAGSQGLTNGSLPTFTQEVWVKFTSINVPAGTIWCVFCEAFTPNSTTDKMNMAIYITGTSGAVSAGYVSLSSGASSWRNTLTSSTNVTAGTWNHVAYTVSFDGSRYQARLFLNGVQVGSSSDTIAPSTSGRDYYIGRRWDSASQLMNGSVGAIRVYNQALSSDQIQQNYLSGAVRYGRISLPSSTVVTTQGVLTSTSTFAATLGTGNKTLTNSRIISGITGDTSTQNSIFLNSAASLLATDTQSARTYIETITATDEVGVSTSYRVNFQINPPIIETATSTLLVTTSGLETSTIIYATRGSSDKTFTRTGTSISGITLTPGTNQATLRVLSTINPGTYWETVTASDTAGATTSIVIQVIVSPPPSITGQTRIESTKGVSATSSLYSISGGTGARTMSLTNSPANPRIILTGTSSSGGYLFIDSTSETGTYTSTIRVTDARGSFSQIVVTVVVNAPVTLSGSLSITKTYGTATTNGYTTNGSGTAPFAFSATPVCAVEKTVTGNMTYERINGTDACTWTAPVGVSSVDALIVGGGGGGGGDGGSGGGGGSLNVLSGVSLPANRQLSIQVGAGGTGGVWGGSSATNGGTTSLVSGATTYTAPGGSGGGGCGAAASAGGARGTGGSPSVGGVGGNGATGCTAGDGGPGLDGPFSNFVGAPTYYGGGGGGGPFPTSIASRGGQLGGAGGGGTGAIAKGFGSYGLPTYFRSLGSTPNAASNQDAFTSGVCGSLTGNINYSADADFPCSQKDNFQGYATGYFVSPFSGSITFCLYSDDSSYLNINGQILSKTGASTSWQCSSAITGFTSGAAYPISVYFTEMGGAAAWKLGYTYTGVGSTSSPVIIPISQFRSGSEGLALYFQTSASTPALASAKTVINASSSDCAERIGAINFAADADFPCSQKDNFQGYGTGYFVAPYTGSITFYLDSDDSSHLRINVNGVSQELSTSIGSVSATYSGFVQGQYYPIEVFFTEIGGVAAWKLSFAYGSQSKIDIPTTYLRSFKDFTEPTAGTNGSGGGGGAGSAGLFKINGAKGGSGTAIILYTRQSDTATETMITAIVNQSSPTGLLTLNVPAFVQVGTYTETITVQDSVNSAPYSATVRITINKATPTATISLPGGATTAQYGTPVAISVNATAPGNVVFRKAGSNISGCSAVPTSNGLATCTWTPNLVETATITAQLSPTDSTNFNNSVETATSLTVVVGRADTLTVTASNLTATYSESGGVANTTIPARTYSLSGLASIDSITSMAYDFAGTINGGTNYATSATAPQQAGSYTITPKSPVFSTGATTNYSRVDFIAGTLTINRASRGAWSATYGAGTNVITYGPGKTETPTVTFPGDGSRAFSTSSTTCSVNTLTGVLTTLGVGSCDIQIVLPQTNNWLSDTKTVTVTINRGLRTATITPALTTIKYGDTTSVTTSILPALDSATVTFSNSNSLGCSVDNVSGLVTGVKAGVACSVRVTFDRTDLYESATATASITINKATAPIVTTETVTSVAYTGSIALVTPTFMVSGILARDISQILPLADVSSVSAIASIAATSYSTVASYRYFATTPTAYDSTTAPSLGGTYAVTPQNLTLLGGLDIGNYETPTYQSSNLVITPIQQAPVRITLSYLESVTVPFDVTFQGGSSTSAPTLAVITGGTAQGCSVDVSVSAMRLKSSSAGTCIIQVTKPADRNYLVALSDTQTVNILNFVVNVIQLFDDNPTGIAINSQVPFTVGDIACSVACVPTITAIQDLSGNPMTDMKVGVPFRIIGTNFNTATRVLFTATIGGTRRSGVPADSFQIDSDTQITVLPPTSFVPNGTDATSNITVRIVVVASGGQSFPNSSITTISL